VNTRSLQSNFDAWWGACGAMGSRLRTFASSKLHFTYRTLLDYRNNDRRLKLEDLSALIAPINIDMHINDHLGKYEHEDKRCVSSSKPMSLP
jgi:hypothetical protein